MTVLQELAVVKTRLAEVYDSRELQAIISLIFSYVKGWSRVDLFMNENKEISDFSREKIDSIVDRMLLGEPIQYITGDARFYGMDFKVGPGVLIPRPETAELVDWIVDDNRKEDLSVVDIGTGSGCIAVSLARTLPFPSVTAVDFSSVALEVAEKNAAALKANVKFIKADMYSWLPDADSLDIVVSNPPYIAPDEEEDMEVRVKDFEPREALFVDGDDPIRPYKRIERIAMQGLRRGGFVYLELNPRFAEDVRSLFENAGWQDVELRIDSYGKKRMLKARK